MSKQFDVLAVAIGTAYRRGLDSHRAGIIAHAEAGVMLAKKKSELAHGQWLPWLKANRDALGFASSRTAQKLMEIARVPNATLASHLHTNRLMKRLWGHKDKHEGPQHLFTTRPDIARIKRVFDGVIHTDPSSCQEANDDYVGATTFYDVERDGLKQDWLGNVLLNPMYDNVPPWIDKLLIERGNGNCTQAITITPNSTDTAWFQKVFKHASAICFHAGRVKFHAPETGKLGNPALGSAFAYFGPNHKKFAATFQAIGRVVKVVS